MKSDAISLVLYRGWEVREEEKFELILCKPERPTDAGLKGFSSRIHVLFIISKMNSAEVGYTCLTNRPK